MKWCARFSRIACAASCLLLLASGHGWAAKDGDSKASEEKKDGKKKDSDSKKDKDEKDKKDEKDEKKNGELSIPIQVGKEARGIKLPYFNKDGKLQMSFVIESAARIDEGHLEMRNVRLQTFDDKGRPDLDIVAPLSILDLETRVVSSSDPVTIRRTDFEITGEKMIFDTKTKLGKFTGKVKMLIY